MMRASPGRLQMRPGPCRVRRTRLAQQLRFCDPVADMRKMSPAPRVLIVGAGLTGCTLAHRLARDGVRSILLERADVPGGLIRSEHMNGVLYEPHGSHIFHTEGEEVRTLGNEMRPL